MTRSYKSNDARDLAKPAKKAVSAPATVKNVVQKTQPVTDHCFQSGDIVSFRTNSRGIVLAVSGNGVQVDFGLGSGWFSKDVLTLVQAAGSNKAD